MREVAEAKGMSLTRLHYKSEITYNAVRRIWRDPYADISTATLARLASALGVDPSELIEAVPDDYAESTTTQEHDDD